jgi:lactate 2-monooxygenase
VKAGRPATKAVRLPISYEGWERAAKDILGPIRYSFLHGGAGEDLTSRANRESFYNCRLVPRVLKDVSRQKLSVTLFGTIFPSPIVLAPVSAQKDIHPEAELASARAAASTGTTFTLSTAASHSIEKVAEASGAGRRWFQLYPTTDRELTRSFLRRAKSSGYSAIVVTVDRAGEYPRYEVHPGFNPQSNAVFFSDPVFRARIKRIPRKEEQLRFWVKIRQTPSFTWKDLAFIRDETRLPIVLKGVIHPEDAKLAIEQQVDGVIVSNHGGRRMDGMAATLDMLPAVKRATKGKIPVMLDSGIRSGVEVVKALALGADAVLIGHLYAYGLAVAGEAGVRQVITNLVSEISAALAICGCQSVQDLDESLISLRGSA